MILVRNLETGIVLRGLPEQVPDLMRFTGAGVCSVHREADDAGSGHGSGVVGSPVTGTGCPPPGPVTET